MIIKQTNKQTRLENGMMILLIREETKGFIEKSTTKILVWQNASKIDKLAKQGSLTTELLHIVWLQQQSQLRIKHAVL